MFLQEQRNITGTRLKKKKKKESTNFEIKQVHQKYTQSDSLNFLSPLTITAYLPIRKCDSTKCLPAVPPFLKFHMQKRSLRI